MLRRKEGLPGRRLVEPGRLQFASAACTVVLNFEFSFARESLAFPKGLEVSGIDHDHSQNCSSNLGSG